MREPKSFPNMVRNLIFIIMLLIGPHIACAQELPYRNTILGYEERVCDLISRMTLEEKISQLCNDAHGIDRLGVLPYNWWSEALHGVARNGKATVFPQAIGLAATFDTALVYKAASAISDEARVKFNVAQKARNYGTYAGLTFWTPNINIFRDPRWGRGQETYGEDPYLTSRIGIAFVKGMQGDDPRYLKTAACAKHYAVHSGPEALRHEFNVSPSKKDLFETYLPAFEALVKEGGVEAVMGAYNRVYGESASASQYLLNDILRGRWGFKGHVVSDCGALDDIYRHHDLARDAPEAAAIAVKAGLDLNCGGTYRHLGEAVERGLVTEAEVNQLLFRLMMTRFRLGLFDPLEDNPYNSIQESILGGEENAGLAYRAAVESMVLLQNKNNVLPLKKDVGNVLVTGPYAADVHVLMGNYYGLSDKMYTYLEGMVNKAGLTTRVEFLPGILPTVQNTDPMNLATGSARYSDATIVVLGESGNTEGEEGDAIASDYNGDRLSLALPPHQIEFLRRLREGHSRPIITVLTGGSPIDLGEVSALSDAVIMAWYPGQAGGLALADIIFGNESPSGRLPVTFPVSDSKLPPYEDYSMKGRTYRYMSDNIMYPFGYGLTYSDVSYSDMKLVGGKFSHGKNTVVEVVIRNTGSRAVSEVVQLYVAAPGAGIDNPFVSLIDFSRQTLQPGESRVVRFAIPSSKLESVMEDGSKKLIAGRYTLIASGSAPCERSRELGVPEVLLGFIVK